MSAIEIHVRESEQVRDTAKTFIPDSLLGGDPAIRLERLYFLAIE
jgi:hypothetical protein